MNNQDGEYWVFSAECNKPFGTVPRTMKVKCEDELDPSVCMDCQFCELTYVPDVITFTPDFKEE